jgi:hypothetical protein
MNGDRFDELTRLVARLGDRRQSRRSVLRAVIGSGALAALSASPSLAAPDRRYSIRSRNQEAGVDPLIDEIAYQLDYDTEKIAAFVTAEIRYEPYAGALRGAIGTLWAGAGNSVDTAQLLAALLEASIVTTRFRTGQADSDELLTRHTATRGLPPSPVIASAIASLLERSATPAASPPDDLQAALDGLRDEIFDDALSQVDAQVGLVTRLLDDAGIATKSAELVIPEMETGQHTWVQVASGTTWIDLHPTLADLPTGATEDSTMAALPDDWFHTITIRVAHEEASAGSLTRVVSLDQTFQSQSVVGGNLALIHIDGAQMNQLGIDLGGALEGQRKYYPLLFLGADLQYGTAPMLFGGQGGILDALSGPSDLPDGEAVAEYLEIEIRSPGAEPITTSRTIFDRVAEQRAAASIDLRRIKPIDEVDVGGDAKRYLPLAPLVSFGAIMGRLPSAFTLIQPPESSQFSSFSDAPRSIQAVGQTIADRSASEPRSEFIDRPNLISYTYAPAKSADGSLSTAHITADLLVQSRAGASDDRARPFGIESGVRAQVAEEMALDSRLLSFMSSQGYSPSIPGAIGATVGRVFRQADADAVPIKVLSTLADLDSSEMTIPDSARALIASHLDRGRVVMAPAQPVMLNGEEALGWWVYDPANGSLIDQMSDGRSAAYLVTMAEFSAKLRMIYVAAAPFLANGECVAAVLNAANDVLTGGLWGAVVGAVEKFGACA